MVELYTRLVLLTFSLRWDAMMRHQSAKETRPLVFGENRRYLAYMLRLWQVNTTDMAVWRASLEDPHTGEQKGFADLESLFMFLKKQTDGAVERAESVGECFSKSDQNGGKL